MTGKEKAASALLNLANSIENEAPIAQQEGALAALVALVRDGSVVGRERAAGALQNLATWNARNQVAIAKEEGALAALVALLLRDDDGNVGVAAGKEKAAGALWFLAKNADNQVAIAKEEGVLAALVTMLRDGTATGKIMAGGAVKLLSENQDAKVALLELGCDASALT